MADWLIAAGDFVTTGGMDAANWHLAHHLAREHHVELVAHRVDPALAAEPNIHVTTVTRPLGKHLLGQPLLRRKAESRARAMRARGGRAVANGGNAAIPDVNWVHYVHAAFDPEPASSGLGGIKSGIARRSALRSERNCLEWARVVICNSRLTQRNVVEAVGIPEAKTRVVYYGCDPEGLTPITAKDRRDARAELGWADRPWAVFVGAMRDRRKGFDTLFAAWQRLCGEPAWDANLAVLGRGAEVGNWAGRARDLGIAARIAFLGFRPDVPRVLAACDLLVHPARYEAYGLGVHEALCRGLPVIVSAQAGVAEQIDATLADLVLPDPESVDDLVARLRHWRANLEAVYESVRPLSARLRERTWTRMAEEFEAVATP